MLPGLVVRFPNPHLVSARTCRHVRPLLQPEIDPLDCRRPGGGARSGLQNPHDLGVDVRDARSVVVDHTENERQVCPGFLGIAEGDHVVVFAGDTIHLGTVGAAQRNDDLRSTAFTSNVGHEPRSLVIHTPHDRNHLGAEECGPALSGIDLSLHHDDRPCRQRRASATNLSQSSIVSDVLQPAMLAQRTAFDEEGTNRRRAGIPLCRLVNLRLPAKPGCGELDRTLCVGFTHWYAFSLTALPASCRHGVLVFSCHAQDKDSDIMYRPNQT